MTVDQLLDAETDDDLFRALRYACGAERERLQDQLVRRHSGLVHWLANRYAHPAVERDELRQVAFTGLVLAIQRFDPDQGREFVVFARPTIQGELRRWFRDKRRTIRLPRRLQETGAALRVATEKLTHALLRPPTIAELAAHLGVVVETVLAALTADDNLDLDSLDAPLGADGNDRWTLAEAMGDPDPSIERVIDLVSLRPLLAAVGPREQQLLRLHFFDGLSQVEISRRVGLSQLYVSRLINRTLRDLRHQLTAD
jgi:RNA polymerase sigma-B factor